MATASVGAVEPGRSFPVVTARDRRTLEVRQVFPLPKDAEAHYALDVYFYFPRSFGISRETFSSEAFYRDAHVYLRLTAPALRLSELCDLEHPTNPAAILRQQLPALLEEDAPSRESMATLAQMYGAELCDAFVREAQALKERVEAGVVAGRTRRERPLEGAVERFCADALHALGCLRRVRAKARAYRAVAHPSLFDSLAFGEEYACAVLDEQLASLGQTIDAAPCLRDGTGLATRLRLRIAQTAEAVNRRRLEQGFAVPWGSSPEYFTYRVGLLKKELQRSLYIDTRKRPHDPFFKNSAAMVAAGLAATWATLAQLPLWTGGWTTRQGLLFLGTAVGAYILKDRIKEWTRDVLSRRFRRWDHDRKIVGDALDQVGLGSFDGRARERMHFVSEGDIPEDVHRLRLAHRTVRGVTPELEVVMHYRRTIDFVQNRASSVPEGFGVQELFRLSLDELLKRLDDPVDHVAFFDSASGRFRSQDMPKVYHLNLVLVATEGITGEQHLSRYRVVVDRKGILRVDPVTVRRGSVQVAPGGRPLAA